MASRPYTTMLEFFGIIVLHFVNCLLWASVVSLTCCTSQVCCSQSPCPCNRSPLTCASTLKHSKGGLAQSLMGSLGHNAHKVLFEPSEHLAGMEFDSKHDFTIPPQSCSGFSFALGCGLSFFGGIQHSAVDHSSTVIYNFGVLTGEDKHLFFCHLVKIRSTEYNSPGLRPFEVGFHCHHYPYHSEGTWPNRKSINNQQNIPLKIYHQSEQDPDFPTASLSHQEASTSLLSLSIKGQMEWIPQLQKTKHTDHLDHSLV